VTFAQVTNIVQFSRAWIADFTNVAENKRRLKVVIYDFASFLLPYNFWFSKGLPVINERCVEVQHEGLLESNLDMVANDCLGDWNVEILTDFTRVDNGIIHTLDQSKYLLIPDLLTFNKNGP
jgi:hypothetical protein